MATKRTRLRIQTRIYNDDTNELLGETMIGGTDEVMPFLVELIERHGRVPMRVEHALSGGRSVVVGVARPNEMTPPPDELPRA